MTQKEKNTRSLLRDVEEAKYALTDEGRGAAMDVQRKRESWTARERIAYLCDPGSFTEIGRLVGDGLGNRANAPAEGVVVGAGRIQGRWAMVMSQDFTVFGGSVGRLGLAKLDLGAERALTAGIPLVMLLDGGGHRIQDGQDSWAYASVATTFHTLARMSGWVPVVAAVLGPGFAANTNFAGLADFNVMVRGKATMGLAGPALVKAGTGEVITTQDLGGAVVQVDKTGLADLGAQSEQEALDAVKSYLAYFPSNAREAPPVSSVGDPCDRRDEALLDLVPANTARAYDVRKVIGILADAGSVFEIKPTYAKNMITSLARLDGRPVGFIANQSLHMAGMLTAAASEKAAHFVALCDAFGLPLIYLVDIPGFQIGSGAEATLLGRRSAKMLHELGHATVPRISIILRKGYGLGYLAMCGGRSFDADGVVAWPTAEICAMSIEGSVDVAYRKDYEQAPDPEARRRQIIEGIRTKVDVLRAAEGLGIDDIIDPRDTRKYLVDLLERVPRRRNNNMPPKFRSIIPI